MHSFITQIIVINNSNRTKDNKQFIHSFIHRSSKAIPLPFNLTSGLLKGSSRILMFQRFIRSFHFYNCKFEERTRNRLKCFIQLELMLFRFSYCSSQMNKIIVIRANFTHITFTASISIFILILSRDNWLYSKKWFIMIHFSRILKLQHVIGSLWWIINH